MSDVMWNALLNYPNAGQAFSDAFQNGMQKNALSALAMNPNDPRAQAAAAPYAPGQVMQARQHQAELTAQEHEAWIKTLGEAAKMADTPEKWDAAVDWFVQQGHPEAAQFKGQFSPGARAALMAQAGIADDKPAADPSMIREFDIATQRGLVPQGMTFQQYVTMRNPGMSAPVTIPYGATVSTPGSQPLTDAQMMQMMNGGQTPPASVPFR